MGQARALSKPAVLLSLDVLVPRYEGDGIEIATSGNVLSFKYESGVAGIMAVVEGGVIEGLIWANAFSLQGELASLALT